MSILLSIFISMVKIGCFAFGGGYAIIALLEGEFVAKRKWIDRDELYDVVAIAEGTPGPIALNVATYVGYRMRGTVGAIVATVGMCLPSFVIMYLISSFYDQFMEIGLVASAFKGVCICVIDLIACAGIKMLRRMKKTPLNILLYTVTCLGMIAFSLLDIRASSLWFVVASGAIALLTSRTKAKKGGEGNR